MIVLAVLALLRSLRALRARNTDQRTTRAHVAAPQELRPPSQRWRQRNEALSHAQPPAQPWPP